MDVVWIIFLFAVGACVGRFLNVVIYRMPRGESIVFPGSHCPTCGKGIRWYDNLPILSWLVLRAAAAACKAAISPRYIVIETATAVLVSGLYVCYFVLEVRWTGPVRQRDCWPAGQLELHAGRCSSPTRRCCAGCWPRRWWTSTCTSCRCR